MRFIVFGPPGAGKGTQAQLLSSHLQIPHLSTGEILRNEIKSDTDIGKRIINDMNDGKFVSDEIVNKLIIKFIYDPQKKDKLIFDGYPRTLNQAKNLDLLLNETNQKIDFIFFLNVNKDTIIKRIEKRKNIEKRSDDDLNTFLARYDSYIETTRPVLDFYSKNRNFHEIDGNLEIDQITRKIDSFIDV